MQPIALPETGIDLAAWVNMHIERVDGDVGVGMREGPPEGVRHRTKVVVGAAIIRAGRVLACARTGPPDVAGKWEFPGGKVEPGESEAAAVIRECAEELGIRVEVGERIGRDVGIGHGRSVLRVYRASLVGADQPRPLEHAALRWLTVDELGSVPWLPADAPIVDALRPWLDPAGPMDQVRR